MRGLWLLPLGLTCLHFTSALANSAEKATIQTGHGNVQQIAALGTTNTAEFDTLRKTTKSTRIESLDEILTNLQRLDGQVVEMQGRVAGLVSRGGERSVLLKVQDATTMLIAPATIPADNLRTGATVRVLATVNIDPKSNTYSLTALATTEKDPQPSLFHDQDDTGVILVPPNTSVSLPRPGPMSVMVQAPPRPAAAPQAVPSAASTRAQDFEAQKEPYKQIIRSSNRKLREDQVDEIAAAILNAAAENQMDPRFLTAILSVESDFDIYCLSSSGAMGLGQLMPFNVKEAHIRNPWDPTENVFGTARLLRGHLNDYRNRPDGTLLAVAAYNAGPGAVRRAGYRVPAGSQVQRYVWKVYYRYKQFAPDMFQ
jgi:hypothetical protein